MRFSRSAGHRARPLIAEDLTPLQRVSAGLLAAIWLVVVADLVFGAGRGRMLAMGCLVAFLLCVVPRATVPMRVLLLVAAAGGTWRGLIGHDWEAIRRGLETGVVMGAFFTAIILLRVTADESPLIGASRERLEGFTEGQTQTWVQAVSYLLGSFLMIGAYLIARAALPAQIAKDGRTRIAEAAVTGMALTQCWSPFFAASAIASQLVPAVNAGHLLLVGLAFSLGGWTLSHLLFRRGMALSSLVPALRGVMTLAIPAAVLAAIVVGAGAATGLRIVDAIAVIVPVVCLVYLAVLGRQAAARALRRAPAALGRLSGELIVLSSAMCIGTVVGGSDAGGLLSQALRGIAGAPLLLITAQVVLIAGLGFAGVHPMITATLMVPLLAGAHGQLADVVLAYLVVFAWGLSSLVAVWTLPVASAAMTFEVAARRLALGRNLSFALAFGALGCLALAGLNRLLVG